MSETLAVQEEQTNLVDRRVEIATAGLSIRHHAVAVNATEMAESNTQIRVYLAAKLDALKHEKGEISEACAIAEENGWDHKALDNVEKKLIKQISYYDKLCAALDAGFTIVPNMPCDQFAIRVVGGPRARQAWDKTQHNWLPNARLQDEKEMTLPQGEGKYVSPTQTIEESRDETKLPDGKIEKSHTVWATGFDPIEFPFAAARPKVMTATQAAMALKLFDRIGIVPQTVRNDEDPIILGQIVLRQNGRDRVASFMIAWHLDVTTL